MKNIYPVVIAALFILFAGCTPAMAQPDPSNPNIRPAADAPATPLERLLTEAKIQYTRVSESGCVTAFSGTYGEQLRVMIKHQPESDLVSAYMVVVSLPVGSKFPDAVVEQVNQLNLTYPVMIKWVVDQEQSVVGVAAQVPRETRPDLFKKVIVTLAGAADREADGLKQLVKQARLTVRTDD
jgi:hypothetical protein